ncbi:4-hydroxy-tetrahydrodipicolinate synthase [Cyanobacterium aponinum AL20118]|nr:4-hydroxy-tetrahydrodipicolinate synthase [Cyanobacterium aponinum]MBD2392844.1 4-hydroxy-tetrahydrodipicolinate synthase [Cyanobacterium aponinum FACHB-4101]PHV63952.1 4-hydroxy-tetrahydrodipicolinate synthase [Cyanobacterium aponinum IPPAS B-1201]WPF88716.1 4-hydroxy-tetrahydrodipicolinate synthase [Cyanobacterium aponinum AL20115]
MSNYIFGRVLTAMVTPFNGDGSVNYGVAEKLADHLVNNGSDGLVICGTTGESPALESDEKYQLLKVVKNAVGDRAKIVMGTGSNSTQKAITETKKASQIGIDGSLQVVPYYNKPPQEGLYQHFGAIARSCPDVPIMLYNIPGRTGKNLEAETTAQLAQDFDNIVAVKEASADLDQTAKINRIAPPNFLIYSGEDFLTLPMMTVGCVGVVSVASHLVGKQMQMMIQSYEKGDNFQAQKIQKQLYPLFKVLFCNTNPIPVKYALQLQGWDIGGFRLPLCNLPPHQQKEVEEVLNNLELI